MISSLNHVAGEFAPLYDPGNAVVPITWCAQNTPTCTLVLAPAAQAVRLVVVAPVAAAGTSWVVVAISGIGIGLALWALLEILFPGEIGIHGLLEYPIDHDTDFDTFDNWGADEGEWYNSLKVYAEVIKTTKLVADRNNIPFAWTDAEDARLKRIIDAACTAQRGAQGTAGCDDNVAVYVPGGVNYNLKPMPKTGGLHCDRHGRRRLPATPGAGPVVLPGTQQVWQCRQDRRLQPQVVRRAAGVPDEVVHRACGRVGLRRVPVLGDEPGGQPVRLGR
ncbi:hypothetical protein [Micromonospora sp. NPDC005161]